MPTQTLRNDAKAILAEIQMIDIEANKKKASRIATLQATRTELIKQIAIIDEVLGTSTVPVGKKRGRPAKTEKTINAPKTKRTPRLTTEEIDAHSGQIKKLLSAGPLSLGGIAEGLKLPKSSTRSVLKSLGKAVKMEGTKATAKYMLTTK